MQANVLTALFIIFKRWGRKCLSTKEQINKIGYILYNGMEKARDFEYLNLDKYQD